MDGVAEEGSPSAKASVSIGEIAIVIPHYNDVARLRRCLDALSRDADFSKVETIVADNGSADDLSSVRVEFPSVRFVVETERGAAAARNRGVAETTAPLIFFLDSDCVPEPGWIRTGVAALERADLVGGAVDMFDETPPPRSGAEAFETVFAFDQKRYVDYEGFSVSANLVTRREVFEAVGGFVPGLSEDVDWCRRAVMQGWRLAYDERLRVRHPTRRDFATLAAKFRRITVEMHALSRDQPLGRLRWGLRAVVMLGSPLIHSHRILRSPRLNGIGERLHGLAVLWGIRGLRGAWMLRQALGLKL